MGATEEWPLDVDVWLQKIQAFDGISDLKSGPGCGRIQMTSAEARSMYHKTHDLHGDHI